MEGILNVRVTLDEPLGFGFKQAVENLVDQTNFPHFNIFGFQNIIRLDGLKLQSPLFSFLNKQLFLMNVLQLFTVVFELPRSEFVIFVQFFFQSIDSTQHLVNLFIFKDCVLVQDFKNLFLFVQLALKDTSELFVKDFVFLHSSDDMVEGFSLGLDLLLFVSDLFDFFEFLFDLLLKCVNACLMSLEPVFHEFDVFLFEVDDGHVLFGLLVHFIVIFSERGEVVGNNGLFIDFGGRVDLLQKVLKHEIFLGAIKALSQTLYFFGRSIIAQRREIPGFFAGLRDSTFLTDSFGFINSTEKLVRGFRSNSTRRRIIHGPEHIF